MWKSNDWSGTSEVIVLLQEETSLDVSDLVGIDPEIYNTVSHLQVGLGPGSIRIQYKLGIRIRIQMLIALP